MAFYAAADEHKLGIMCQQLRDSSYVPDGLNGVDYSDRSSSTPGIIFTVVVLARTYPTTVHLNIHIDNSLLFTPSTRVVALVLAYQFYFKDLLNRRRGGGGGGGHRLGGAGSSASAPSVQSQEAREVSLLLGCD